MSVRLAAIAPDLVSRLDSRSDTELANIVAVVAREAAVRSGLDEPLVASALDRVGTGETSLSDRSEVEELAARLDEHAWDIQESDDDATHDSQRYLVAFQRARAASAVAYARTAIGGLHSNRSMRRRLPWGRSTRRVGSSNRF